ncbi:molybdopterin synthase catalytic subunit isoform X1 [Drosophila montana]|uniref:molybdopterin synthase catalytic subunit isoform X1 n=2 Tax=Drosophila montana TaxID=40370 RepID=UPI00313B08A6
MDHIQLFKDKIDVNLVHQLLIDQSCGACSVFLGTTRDSFEGKNVISLEYEAYENMALKEMGKICTDLRVRWPSLKHIVMYHRLGIVPVSEVSVVIAASAPHRVAALESVNFAIDQLKSRVPIWKKELYEKDLIGEWKANVECPWPQYSKTPLRTFEFFSCKIDQKNENIPDKLVQIRVDDSELNRRVKCFLKRKRDEINLYNINDFKQLSTNAEWPDSSELTVKYSCARTQSSLVKQQQSTSHLKVRREINNSGPPVRPNYSFQLNKLTTAQHYNNNSFENNLLRNSRLRNIEDYMCVTSDDDNILNRIKNIENKILLLESISPEYKYFIQFGTDLKRIYHRKAKKEIYMSDRLNEFISIFKK